MLKTLSTLTLAILLAATPAPADAPFLTLQSTTSTQNSGLLDAILPEFTEKTGLDVRVVAVGTGQAIQNAVNGDADVLLVHAKAKEEAFVADGWGVERKDVMYNDFVVVGPESDPVGIKGRGDAVEVLKMIADAEAVFLSRGDASGTHTAELRLWSETSIDVAAASGTWYRETGSGMGTTLNVAVGMNAYALTDRATWIAFGNKADHTILVEGDPRLFNQYGIILVNPERHPKTKATAGHALIDWLTGDAGQRAIETYKIDGQQLFFPNASGG